MMGEMEFVSLEEAAHRCRLRREVVEFLVDADLIPVIEQGGQRYIETLWLEELRRARRLLEDLEVNLPGVEVILRMRHHLIYLADYLEYRESYYQERLEQLRQQYEERIRALQQAIIVELPTEDRDATS